MQFAAEKSDVVEHYGDDSMPSQMRVLYQSITGRAWDRDLQMHKSMESDGYVGYYINLDPSNLAKSFRAAGD